VNLLGPDYLDPELPLSRDDLKEIRGRAWKLWFADRRNLSLYIVIIVALNLAADFGWRGYRGAASTVPWWHWVIAGAIFIVILYIVLQLLQRWRFAPLARRIAREQGFNICLKCGRGMKDEDKSVERCARHR
jgi:hypothetical protein